MGIELNIFCDECGKIGDSSAVKSSIEIRKDLARVCGWKRIKRNDKQVDICENCLEFKANEKQN